MQEFSNFVSFVEKRDIEKCDIHLRLQSRLIDLNNLDFLGRFESFYEDLEFVFNNIGCKLTNFEVINATSKAHFTAYYTDELIQRVAKIYKKDIQIFGYRFP